jgi:hypothetical protein
MLIALTLGWCLIAAAAVRAVDAIRLDRQLRAMMPPIIDWPQRPGRLLDRRSLEHELEESMYALVTTLIPPRWRWAPRNVAQAAIVRGFWMAIVQCIVLLTLGLLVLASAAR